MKKFGRRFAALAMALVLAAPAGQTAYASWALGEELTDRTVALAQGAELTSQSLWSASKSDLRTEHYVTYTPGGEVRPVVFSGTYVASTNTVAAAAGQLEAQGFRVAAAVNGGWFNSDGTIVGMLMTDGVVRSLDVNNYTLLGFTSDGRIFIDESALTKRMSWLREDGTEFDAILAGFNAYRTSDYAGELFLYNQDFSSRVTSGGGNVSAILRPVGDGALRMNGSLTFEVVSVADATQEGAVFDGTIPEGCYMLYAEDHGSEWLLNGLRELTPGRQVTLTTGGASEQWNDAAYGISSLYTLLREGEIVPGLPTSVNPYTAVGVKPDGSAVFYTIDGRQGGYSIGATYDQVAERLQELGCVSAVALDGGGSTSLGATLPGSNSFSIVNSPSTSGRRLNNTILLVSPDTGATGAPAGAYVTAPRQVVLAGAELAVSALPYDTAGYPLPGGVPVWAADGGIVRETMDGTFYSNIVPGTYTVSASPAGGGAMKVRVVDALSRLVVSRDGSSAPAGSIILKPGEDVELDAAGFWWNLPVAMDDEDVVWQADPAVGTIDPSGHFTAVQDNAQGAVTASAGGRTVSVQVTVDRGDPFTDMAGHWSGEYVTRLYQLGLTTGYAQPDGSYIFRPDGKITRGELLTFITRLLQVDASLYEDIPLPFADADAIPGWQLPYVKAMYALGVFEGSRDGGLLYANVGSNVTREAAMTMLGRVLAASISFDLSGFADAGLVSGWASPHVQTLAALGIVEGSGGLLNPKADITRAAAAKLLVSVYGLEKAPLAPAPETGPAEPLPVEPSGPDGSQPDDPSQTIYVNPVAPTPPPVQDRPADLDQPLDTSWSVFD